MLSAELCWKALIEARYFGELKRTYFKEEKIDGQTTFLKRNSLLGFFLVPGSLVGKRFMKFGHKLDFSPLCDG